jgi:pyruvate formate lyase activating enzyme
MKEALLYDRLPNDSVRCRLCAHQCIIHPGESGICGNRENLYGRLYALNYGRLTTQHVDAIEKKPLYHFYPGSTVYSIGTVGCNFRCANCQNFEISQMPVGEYSVTGGSVSPEEVVEQAIRCRCPSIAYTYNEPAVFYEYVLDVARLAHERSIRNVFVTNGYLTPDALHTLAPYLDAVNVDLKSFSNEFYRTNCRAQLRPVLATLELLKQLSIWVEVSTLLIPTMNDTEREIRSIAEFLVGLGRETPWHVSAFYPAFRLRHLPPTPSEVLQRAREIGLEEGLRYVYTGNIDDAEREATYCYNCGREILSRRRYEIVENHISNGCCPFCRATIDGIGMQNWKRQACNP